MSEELKKLRRKARILVREKKLDEAIIILTKIIKLEKIPARKAQAYNTLGIAYSIGKNYGKAIKSYNKAIDFNSKYAKPYHNLGHVYYRQRNYLDSFEHFKKAGEFDKKLKSSSPFVYIASRFTDMSIGHGPEDYFERYTQLLYAIHDIKHELFYRPSKDKEIAHYTSLDVLKPIANGEPFRLYNAVYMNDPEEGRTFFEIMKDKMSVDMQKDFYGNDSENLHFPPAYIGSFFKIDSREQERKQPHQKDELFLWRTYGKHDNQEAAGACFVFNTELFAKEKPLLKINAMSQLQASDDESTESKLQPALYNVIYKQEIESNSVLLEKLEALGITLQIVNTLISISEDKTAPTRLMQEMLDDIRFLFKADHYKEEQEARVVKMFYYADKEEQSERKVDVDQIPPRFYLEIPGNIQFSEVIFGPQTSNVSEWKQWLKERDIKNVSQSKIKFRGNSG